MAPGAGTIARTMCARRNPFFDPAKAAGPRRGPDVGRQPAPATGEAQSPLSVSDLLARVKAALDEALPKRVCVVGEISNLNLHTSGHAYFSLKDAAATIDAVMFRPAVAKLKFTPADGLEVVAEGRVDVYDVRGQLQLYVQRMTPRGQGALELAFRQLCEKLRSEGLFAPEAKKPLVRIPRAIGVVTSPTGAAVRDIRRTLARRWPVANVYLLPVLVQGDRAADDVARAVRLLDANAPKYLIDTIIVARGGGSLEDLWAFNEEPVARAIFAARTPIISGVGHEVDVTVADLVADVRAATPTAAAELAVPDQLEVRRHGAALISRLGALAAQSLKSARLELSALLRSVVFRDPSFRHRTHTQHVDELSHRLVGGLRQRLSSASGRLEPASARLSALPPARQVERAAARLAGLTARLAWALGGRSKAAGDRLADVGARMLAASPTNRLRLARQKIDAAARQLEAMSYRNVLTRGFSVTRSGDGRILRHVNQVTAGDLVETELADGKFTSRAGDDQQGPTPQRRRPRKTKHAKPQGPTLFET